MSEPVTFYVCKGCGHYYMDKVSSCDCLCDLDINEVQLYSNPDPRVAELEAVLRECREVLMHYQYGGSNYKKPAEKAIAKIDEVLPK